MSAYDIEDLMEEYCGECSWIEEVTLPTLKSNNKKPMNMIEQKRVEQFVNSKRIDEVEATITLAEEAMSVICQAVWALDNINEQISQANFWLTEAVEQSDIKTISQREKEVKTMLAVLNKNPLLGVLSSLVEAFGIEGIEADETKEEDVIKSFGIKTPSKKK